MNLFGRAGRSVVRKPIKSALLFLAALMISVFLLSGMASRSASVKTQDNTRQAVGAGFVLEPNQAYRTKRASEISERLVKETGGEGEIDGFHQEKLTVGGYEAWMSWSDNKFDSMDREDIERVAGCPGICDYNITTAITPVNPVGFKRIEEADVDHSGEIQGVSLIGNLDMQMDSNVLSGNLTIKEGRMVGKEDENVCVISEELAELNQLKVGDKISFNDYHDRENSTVYEAEVIGIYQVKQKMTPLMSGDDYRSENVIFTDLRFPEKPQGESDPAYVHAYLKVEDVKAYDEVKEKIKQIDIDWEKYDFIDNNGNYDTMSTNFNKLENISNILLLVVAVASFIILFLIFVFWQKSRVQEIGIFLSMGMAKMEIIGQILSEGLMIAVSAVLVSFAAAPGVSGVMADYLVEQQVQQAEEQKKVDEGYVDYGGAVQPEEEVHGVSVHITPQMMAFDGAAVMILVSLSVITSSILIVMKKPKDILSEMS